MGRPSNDSLKYRQQKEHTILGMVLLVILLTGLFLIMPGVFITVGIVELIGASPRPSQMWSISLVVAVITYFIIRWRSGEDGRYNRTYITLCSILTLVFILLRFGFELPMAIAAFERFIPPQPQEASSEVAHQGREMDVSQSPPNKVPRSGTLELPIQRATIVEEPPRVAPVSPSITSRFRYRIVGVSADDTLTVRHGPGMDFSTSDRLAPSYKGITRVIDQRSNGSTEWLRIEFEGRSGWVAKKFIEEASP